mgnify:CR=1 FL=1
MEKNSRFPGCFRCCFLQHCGCLEQSGIYNDSNQYIAMHIHREPLYSFFLWIFRSLFGETKYLDIVRFLQNGLAAFSVIWLAESLKKTI